MKSKYEILNEILDLLDESVNTLSVEDCDYVYERVLLAVND